MVRRFDFQTEKRKVTIAVMEAVTYGSSNRYLPGVYVPFVVESCSNGVLGFLFNAEVHSVAGRETTILEATVTT
jgi:hypothetical protein